MTAAKFTVRYVDPARRSPRTAAPERLPIATPLHTPEQYRVTRKTLLALSGELEPSSPYYSETPPAEWLALARFDRAPVSEKAQA